MPTFRLVDDSAPVRCGAIGSQETDLLTQPESASTGAPAGEPETWDTGVQEFSPLLGKEPEPPEINAALVDEFAGVDFEIEAFLAAERSKDLLRFSTAGSVDDGKSTLIGRLLYDTRSVYEDQVRSIEGKGSAGAGVLDLALLTDGLRAEREQGITIDVAYRYFATARRKFIIADTPGHIQYTRNMATGASTADVAIVLLDARKGVLPQSRRHAYITALLGVGHVIVAVNKMDLIAFDRSTYERILGDFKSFFDGIEFGDGIGTRRTTLTFVPVSALAGDNVAYPSSRIPWYEGPTLLECLEGAPIAEEQGNAPFRLAVQRVVRPDLHFRGFAGQIASGTLRRGDLIVVQPAGRTSRVARLVTFDGELQQASAPASLTIVLEEEIDISRGDLLSSHTAPAVITQHISASLVWMDEAPLQLGRRYLLKHTSRLVSARVSRVASVASMEAQGAPSTPVGPVEVFGLNGIGLAELHLSLPLVADLYATHRTTGSFVLIDPETNVTAAAGMIRGFLDAERQRHSVASPVTMAERADRWHHAGALIALEGPIFLAQALERTLFDRGAFVLQVDRVTAPVLAAAGGLAITLRAGQHGTYAARIGDLTVSGSLDQAAGKDGPTDASSVKNAVSAILQLLIQWETAEKRRKP